MSTQRKRAPLGSLNQNVLKRQKAEEGSSTAKALSRKEKLRQWNESRASTPLAKPPKASIIHADADTESTQSTTHRYPTRTRSSKTTTKPFNQLVQEKTELLKRKENQEAEERNRKVANNLHKKAMEYKLKEEKLETKIHHKEQALAKREHDLQEQLAALEVTKQELSLQQEQAIALRESLNEREMNVEAGENAVVERQKEAWLLETKNTEDQARLTSEAESNATERERLEALEKDCQASQLRLDSLRGESDQKRSQLREESAKNSDVLTKVLEEQVQLTSQKNNLERTRREVFLI